MAELTPPLYALHRGAMYLVHRWQTVIDLRGYPILVVRLLSHDLWRSTWAMSDRLTVGTREDWRNGKRRDEWVRGGGEELAGG